jgi:hypothetical protein
MEVISMLRNRDKKVQMSISHMELDELGELQELIHEVTTRKVSRADAYTLATAYMLHQLARGKASVSELLADFAG